jgi:hypothetical protein
MEPLSLTVAFSIWAAVVAMVGGGIVFELSRLRMDVRQIAERLNSLALDHEHRLTAIESDMRRCMMLQGLRQEG